MEVVRFSGTEEHFLHSTKSSPNLLLLRNISCWTCNHCIKFAFFLFILVLVRDSGNPLLSSTVTVICTVLDENDHSPTFLLPTSEICIPENQEPSVIYIMRAVDMDAGNNGALRYKIIGKLYSIIFVSINQEVYKQQYPRFRFYQASLAPILSICLFYVEEKKDSSPLC